ncbi:MAG TPA: cytochrome c biogenesis CcdA family protein [Candidatus Dorea intestinavium]|nr:cytochrome c biogenesis CcdA family protein [Candidatus Dorea intestinavium]
MQYILLFLEGIITFISPCILPMVPVYVSYFMGAEGEKGSKNKTLVNALSFVAGFSFIFTLLGVAAGSVGLFLNNHMRMIHLICGIIMIIFGLNFMEILNIKLLNNTYKPKNELETRNMGFLSALIFGMIFAVGWTPCVGPFLGSALMIATSANHGGEGALMLFVYSLGLGVPFLLSAALIKVLSGAFTFVKKHYKIIKIISGILLIVIGLLMATGYLNKFLSLLTF